MTKLHYIDARSMSATNSPQDTINAEQPCPTTCARDETRRTASCMYRIPSARYLLQSTFQECSSTKPKPSPRSSVELAPQEISTALQPASRKKRTLTTPDRPRTGMFAVVPIPQIRIPGRTVSLLGLHLLVDQVKRVDVAGEVAEDGEADVTASGSVRP